jgi:hypothetical protein
VDALVFLVFPRARTHEIGDNIKPVRHVHRHVLRDEVSAGRAQAYSQLVMNGSNGVNCERYVPGVNHSWAFAQLSQLEMKAPQNVYDLISG